MLAVIRLKLLMMVPLLLQCIKNVFIYLWSWIFPLFSGSNRVLFQNIRFL